MKKGLRVLAAGVASVLSVGLCFSVSADSWTGYRGNDTNNGVVTAKIPTSADNAALYWATKIGTDWNDTPSSVTMVNDKIIFTASDRIYSMDKETGVVGENSTQMVSSSSWSMIAPCYADGMIFVGLANGTVQAFDADTMESLWVYKDALGGQPNSPFTYSDGKVYTGFWNSETGDADFVCIDVADEDTESSTEEKSAVWTYKSAGGFYWAGAYANDNFITIATDDGASSSAESAKVITFDKDTGAVLDEIDNVYGDIRSSMVYDEQSDRFYFTSKGGLFCSVKISDEGKISDYKELILNGTTDKTVNPVATTSSPVISNGRAYIGVSGKNAYSKYTGSGILVIDLESFTVAYKAETMGYPQLSGLGATDEDGYNYVYFVENASPSEIRFVKDKKGVTETLDSTTETYNGKSYQCAPVLWTPAGAQVNYAISNLICDEDGTLYFKNDSAYIMAVGSTVKSVEVTPSKTLYKAGDVFDTTGITVTAEYTNGVKKDIMDKVSVYSEPLTTDDTFITVTFDYALYQDKTNENSANSKGVNVSSVEKAVDVNVLSSEDYEKVENVIKLIDEIGEVTKDSGEKITLAREAYDQLDKELVGYIDNIKKLENSEKAFADLNNESDVTSDVTSENSSENSSQTDVSSEAEESSQAESVESSSKVVSSSSTSSNASSSSTNPATGFAKGGMAVGITAILGAVVVGMRKKK